jgi:hypothetical protein
VELDVVSVLNDRQSLERTGFAIFPDPEIYAVFKVIEYAQIMKGFLQLLYEERTKFKPNPATWIVEYRKEHPNSFLPTLQQTLRKWMTNFSKKNQLQYRSGLSKRSGTMF